MRHLVVVFRKLRTRVELLVDFLETRVLDMGVNLRCLDAGVTEHFLDLA